VLFVALLEDIGAKSAVDEQRRALASERPAGWAAANGVDRRACKTYRAVGSAEM